MRSFLVFLIAATFPLLASPASSADRVLKPTSSWVLDYAPGKCRLMRKFADSADEIELHFEQSSAVPFYNVAIFGPSLKATRRKQMIVQFGPDEGPTERSYLEGKLDGSKAPFILMHGVNLAPVPEDAKQGEFPVVEIGPAREVAITTLRLEQGIRGSMVLEIGSMGAPLNSMRDCIADLIKANGLDDEGQAKIIEEIAFLNEAEVAKYLFENYPVGMLKVPGGGTVAIRLTIDDKGKPTTCQIAKSDRPAAYDDFACLGMMRIAKFKPALGPDGKPHYSTYSTKIKFSERFESRFGH